VSRRSLCSRDRVGAVIVSHSNRVVATGYNGPPAHFPHAERPCVEWCPRAQSAATARSAVVQDLLVDPGYMDCPALHAEANALSVCDRSSRENGAIYVTSVVCFGCAKLIANSGLSTVVIPAGRTGMGIHRDPSRSYDFLRQCGLTVRSAER
jgi:dCMP deaminase